ncbi:TniQ family protein [Chitinolyticbacter meiyuanensis]|uniref:TniQ family protein n=1 Tax=Chitinolyticbacter meiyuanensis TaxID=682798 RepID=UPI0011E5C988|nr:TniQ family protein [Chitinolyticbacter meiyuanensis]
MKKARLPVRPISIVDESPAGLLIRVAEGNGYPNVSALIYAYLPKRCCKTWVTAAHTEPVRYQHLLRLLGVPYSTANSIHFTRKGPTRKSPRYVGSHVFPEKLFRTDGEFYCPYCLGERKYWRKHWALRPYSVCREHQVYLRNTCHACGATINAWRGHIDQCGECGTALSLGDVIEGDSRSVIWWLSLHESDSARAAVIDDLCAALAEFDGDSRDPQDEQRRLCALMQWVERGEVAPWIVDQLSSPASTLHPRIQLLPLLRLQHGEAQRFAIAALKHVEPSNMVPSLVTHLGDMTNRDAQLALGIKPSHMRHFFSCGLFRYSDGRHCVPGQVSLHAVNEILYRVQGDMCGYDGTVERPNTRSLASVVADVMWGGSISVGYVVSLGLTTIRLKPASDDEHENAGTESGWLGLRQIATVLETYPEAARKLMKFGWIPHRSRDLAGAKRLIAHRDDVEHFNQQYMLIGTFAAHINENPTNLAERLMALGLKPVAGPSVDGMLVYVFRRDELERVDLKLVHGLTDYPTRTGRKLAAAKHAQLPEVRDVDGGNAATILGVRRVDIHKLIRAGVLVRSSDIHRDVHVTLESLRQLQLELRRPDMISVTDAASRLGMSTMVLESVWAAVGLVTVRHYVLWRLISVPDIERLETLLSGHITAADAGKMLGTHRAHLHNLERRGVLRSVVVGQGRRVRLYDRARIEALLP